MYDFTKEGRLLNHILCIINHSKDTMHIKNKKSENGLQDLLMFQNTSVICCVSCKILHIIKAP